MKIFIIRGAFLNPFELQNFSPLREKFDIKAISSKFPLSEKIELPLIKLWSPTDLPNFPFKFPILNRIYTDAHKLFGLEKVIRGADIVHVAETYYGYTHQAILAKRRGEVKKIISTVWETIPHNNEGIKGRKGFKNLARENIDHFIAVTNLAKQTLIKEGVKPEKISVIPVGVDLNKFKPQLTKKKKRDLNILCIARLVPEKGVMDLLEAFLKLSEKDKNVHLTFIGDGPLKSDLTGYKNVFVKKVPYNKIPYELNHADILCLPSKATRTWEEQFGMVLVEAMSSGLPIIATDTGAIPEVCEDCALYSKSNNPASLRANLEKLLYNEDLRHKMSKISRRRAVRYFDRDKIAVQIENLYKKICPSKEV